MSIPGQQTIGVGLPNESTGSDDLYTAFNKVNNNFDTLFSKASPYNTFISGQGVSVESNASLGTISFTNTGVTNIIAGTNIVIDQSNGNVTISSTGGNGGGGGTVTSVGVSPVSTDRLTSTNSPITTSGEIYIDLAESGVTAGTYTNPTVIVDQYGRIISASSGPVSGTVTSVGLTAGSGIQINGGPITSNGSITVTNTGVTRLSAGPGIALSGSNGNVTVSAATSGGTVTSIGITSSQLVVSNSPVVSSGTISVNLPDSVTFTGNVTTGGIKTDNLYYANGQVWDLGFPSGSNNQIQFNSNGGFGASANLAFDSSNNVLAVSGTIIANTSNVTNGFISNATMTVANITGNASVGNLSTVGEISADGDVSAGNIVVADSTNLVYDRTFGGFYSNITFTNPVANAENILTFNTTHLSNGISIVDSSKIVISRPGYYNLAFSLQLYKTDPGLDYITVWIKRNGNAVPYTSSLASLSEAGERQIMAANFVFEVVDPTDYHQLVWASADTAFRVETVAAVNGRPASPSVIVTVTPVGA